MEFKKDGSLSKMRSHRGNIPVLPQTKLCPHCPAKFTRTTHLNRHLRTHTNERLHRCDTCDSQFTRSDLLTRHKKSCSDPLNRTRRKSCASCMESKIKCDRQYPCSKCATRGKECVFTASRRKVSASTQLVRDRVPIYADSPSETSMFTPTPETDHSYSSSPFPVQEPEDTLGASVSSSSISSISESDSLSSPQFDGAADLYSLAPSDFGTATDSTRLLPVHHSHLSSSYVSDMFEPFFSNIFSQPSSTLSIKDEYTRVDSIGLRSGSPEEFPFATRTILAQTAFEGGRSFESLIDTPTFAPSLTLGPALSDVRHSPILDMTSSIDPPAPELQHYLYLFFSAFLSQIPIVHATCFSAERKPPVLLSAMQACGALFVKTRKAAMFITKTLASAREALVQEFAKNPTDSSDQIHLILAVVLLQTIGLFHQQSDQRASSSIYHGMLVMMIRRTGMITKNASWEPGSLTEVPLETLWQEWVSNEMTKRAIWWSYLHDCCHSIYFALPSSYHPSEIELKLPCEDALWRAGTATDWFMALQASSPYGSSKSRLVGVSMARSLASISETRLLTEPIPLNPFAHFILIHSVLRHLFVTCVEGRLPKSSTVIGGGDSEIVNQEIFCLQYALHNWLHNWMNSPELPKTNDSNDEPPFIHNALPFYWLGHVSLLAYQESLPPFEQNSANNLKVEVRFRLVKQWLKHIRDFLRKGDQAPTLFWDELMKVRLQTWQQEIENDSAEDQEGVLGFFPEH